MGYAQASTWFLLLGALTLAADDPAVRLSPASTKAQAESGAPVSTDQADYVLGAEDLLDIRVLGVDPLSSTVRVSESGHVTLPLLGEVRAAGLTRVALEQALAARLDERYVQDAQVSVFVKEYGSRMVSVLGAVRQPGRYPMLGRRTLLDMVSDAGGLTQEAGPTAVITHRPGGAAAVSRTTTVDLDAVLYQGRQDLNPVIEPGDLIHVPIDRPMRVYVDGAVKAPGELTTTLSRPLTLLQAVTRAGGLTERASLRKVQVLRRRPDGGQEQIPVDLKRIRRGHAVDILLQDGDVVIVPETYF